MSEIAGWWQSEGLERLNPTQGKIAAFLLSDLAELPSTMKVSKLILDDGARKEVAVLWARAKAINQAIELAQAIREPDFCCTALRGIAEELLQVGMKEQARELLEQAVKVATEWELVNLTGLLR